MPIKVGENGRKLHTSSVRTRLLSLLETYDGEWFTMDRLEVEHSDRFGPVNRGTLERAIWRELEEVDAVIVWRIVRDLNEHMPGGRGGRLQVRVEAGPVLGAEYLAGKQRHPLPPGDPRHGTRNGYSNLGCRCEECREENRLNTERHNAKKAAAHG